MTFAAGAACLHLPEGRGRLHLLPERAAHDPDLGLLLVADAHIGKAVSFRRLGVPVPAGTTQRALQGLSRLVQATGARHLVFLGDLLHSARAQRSPALDDLRTWRLAHAALDITLVRGNHDAHAGDPPAALGIACIDGPWRVGPWALQHQPASVPGAYALAGHVHPGVLLRGRAHQRLRLPCFHFGTQGGVLPAFGPFTGLHCLPRQAGDRLFAVLDDDPPRVLPV